MYRQKPPSTIAELYSDWTPMLWNVEGTGVRLLSTMHIYDSPMVLGDAIDAAIDEAQIVVFEASLEAPRDPRLSLFKSGGRLSDAITPDLFAATVADCQQLGIDVDIESRRPWAMAIAVVGAHARSWGFTFPGVEEAVKARLGLKTRQYLETPDAQMQPMAKGPALEQEAMLHHAVRRTAEGHETMLRMARAWGERRPEDLQLVFDQQNEAFPTINAGLLRERNAKWLPHILRLTKGRRKAVVAVGGLHMVGPGNLLELLAGAGYTCTPQAC